MADGLSIGDLAPAFELPDTAGSPTTLPAPGTATAGVVIWTCNHCPYALAWHDRLLELARDYADRDVITIAINSNDAERYPADSPGAMAARVEADGGWPIPYVYDADQSVARAYGALRTPDIFIFDGDQRLRYRGAPDSDYDDPSQNAAWLRNALDALCANQQPDPAETDPVGCTIKWRNA